MARKSKDFSENCTISADICDIARRLIELAKVNGLSIREFERTVGFKEGYLHSMRRAPAPDKIEKVVDIYPDLSLEWLILGRGEMMKNAEHPVVQNDKCIFPAEMLAKIDELASQIPKLVEQNSQLQRANVKLADGLCGLLERGKKSDDDHSQIVAK